jgi:hypothetical protein
VTGACTNGSVLYFLGNDYYSQPVIQSFTTSGSASSVYMTYFPGVGTTRYDTAWRSGGVWVARDNAESPILAYDTGGACAGFVEGALIGGAAMGLTVDGGGHLWASNADNDVIYELEVTTGTAEGSSAGFEPRGITLSENPFGSSVVISGTGFGDAVLEIYDMSGRIVETSSFRGSYRWDASEAPAGAYLVRLSDGTGSETARAVRIR